MRRYVVACRTQREQLPVVAAAGLKYVEIDIVPESEVASLKGALTDLGLVASSVVVRMDINSDAGIAHLPSAFSVVEQLGASVVFTSVSANESEAEAAIQRLRRVGDLAKEHGLTVALETHRNLAENSRVQLRTMSAVDHENIRINFDTGNIYYYNRGLDAVSELSHALPYVASLHLKDTMGEYESFDFPPLGQGIVDFPGVFNLLDHWRFDGPLTMELEGPIIQELGLAKALEVSISYLKDLGLVIP